MKVCLFTVFLAIVSNALIAQGVQTIGKDENIKEFNLRSLDGKFQKITIIDDYKKERFIIGTEEDTICLFQNFGPPEIAYLDSSFLKMVYLQHGGMDLVKFDVAVLCIKNGKPYIVLNMRESESFVKRRSGTI